jgi:transcriptional regulator with XRE-family HTH domain
MDDSQKFVRQAVDVQMTRKKMSQRALAKQIGVSYSYLNGLMNQGDWTISVMDKVASALGLKNAFELMTLAKNEREFSSQEVVA